ncbi:hypothetical protein B5S28_g1002 [[Candida] boidinii]|nr:hypothetical protein B5S28_g1002 [[Candida] boidinii]OWB76543.1 hypothetical protein B5S32_g696 [[Candida] boidinii]
MSFRINWESLQKKSLSTWSTSSLNEALNSGKKPNIINGEIQIVDLNLGNKAPDFEILEVGDLGPDKFRGIFKFKYDGDASITVNTKVQASPLTIYSDNIIDTLIEQNNGSLDDLDFLDNCSEISSFVKPKFNDADVNFSIPLNLKLSEFKLSSIIIIVFSKTKGLTLVFKNDPLESISVNSSFDTIKPIAKFLQKKIELQISELFREQLPSLLYKFSLKYTTESFDQFQKDLLNELDLEEKRIHFKDIDPEAPSRISPGSLMRLTTLSTSRQTLAFGGKLSCDRLNKDIISKTFADSILSESNSSIVSRIQLSNIDLIKGKNISSKVSLIKEFQTRSFLKNNHDEKSLPKRRSIKLGKSKNKNNNNNNKKIDNTIITNNITKPAAILPESMVLPSIDHDLAESVNSDDASTIVGDNIIPSSKSMSKSHSHVSSISTTNTLVSTTQELKTKLKNSNMNSISPILSSTSTSSSDPTSLDSSISSLTTIVAPQPLLSLKHAKKTTIVKQSNDNDGITDGEDDEEEEDLLLNNNVLKSPLLLSTLNLQHHNNIDVNLSGSPVKVKPTSILSHFPGSATSTTAAVAAATTTAATGTTATVNANTTSTTTVPAKLSSRSGSGSGPSMNTFGGQLNNDKKDYFNSLPLRLIKSDNYYTYYPNSPRPSISRNTSINNSNNNINSNNDYIYIDKFEKKKIKNRKEKLEKLLYAELNSNNTNSNINSNTEKSNNHGYFSSNTVLTSPFIDAPPPYTN